MSQLGSAISALHSNARPYHEPISIYWITRTFIDTLFATGWEFDDVYYAVITVRDKFARDTRHHKILSAFCETDLDLLPNAMLIRCGFEEGKG